MRCRITFILMVAIATAGYSQYVPSTTTVHTPYGNSTMPSYEYRSTSYGNPNYSGSGVADLNKLSKLYEFTIVLKVDSTITAKANIDLSNSEERDYHKIAIRKNKKDKAEQVYYPIDTKSISRITEDGEKLIGIPADSCWLFKTATGKINSYSFLAEPATPYVIAIQKGDDGPIIPLNKINLSKIVESTDVKLHKLIEKNRLVEALVLYNKN